MWSLHAYLKRMTKMGDTIGIAFCLLLVLPLVYLQENTEHREFQYNSVVDPSTGRYNFAYDTGNRNDDDIGHSMHMQYQDANGIVRGRYGYTDPNGKLRVVEYEAGPNGFVARGDVGPDGYPHDQLPVSGSDNSQPPVLSSLTDTSANDFDLDPAPVQMAGWDPTADPINQVQPGTDYSAQRSGIESENPTAVNSDGDESSNLEQPQYTTINVTSENALDMYGPELGFYNSRYPRIAYSLINDVPEGDSINANYQDDGRETTANPAQENPSLNIHNIDVDPNEIRAAADTPANTTRAPLVRRSGDTTVRASYRVYPRQTHDHDAEMRSRWAHDHYNERTYRLRQTHDHDAEKYRARQTHDHDAEKYRARQTHDHDAEKYRARQTHDHDAERYRYYRYYRYPDHNADRVAYYQRVYGRYNYPRRIFYRDSHSMEPHEHYDNPVYQNYRDHQHYDTHTYGRYRHYAYPATAKPNQLHYVPADKYHDKAYYWVSST